MTPAIGRALAGAAVGALLVACGGHATGPKPPLDTEKAAPAARLEDLRGALVSIDVAGVPEERVAAARSVLHSSVGAPFDRAQVAADLRAIWGLGAIADVHADARPAQGGVALRFTVREVQRIRSIDVTGTTGISSAQWLAKMPIKNGDFADPVRLAEVRRSMLEQLLQAGFHNAKVTWKATEVKGAGVNVVFEVEQGKLVSLASIEFRGNKAVSKKELLALMAKDGGAATGQRYWRNALEHGLDQVSNRYFDLGYVNAIIGPVGEKLGPDGAAMTVTVPIQEGDQYRLGELAFQGALVAPAREYASRFGLRRGQVFSRRKIAEGMDKIRELHRSKGQPVDNIVPITEMDAGKKRIKVTIQVGPLGQPPAGQGQPPAAQGPAGKAPAQAPAGKAPAQPPAEKAPAQPSAQPLAQPPKTPAPAKP